MKKPVMVKAWTGTGNVAHWCADDPWHTVCMQHVNVRGDSKKGVTAKQRAMKMCSRCEANV